MKKRKTQTPYIVALILVVILCALCSAFCFQLTLIQGESMEPSYRSGQFRLLNKLDKNYQQGDVVLFHSEELSLSLVKRIAALPGDRVRIKEGRLYVNGKSTEAYPGCPLIEDAGLAAKELIVPEGCCFVLGDNFSQSRDSRHEEIAFVSIEDIRGKLI